MIPRPLECNAKNMQKSTNTSRLLFLVALSLSSVTFSTSAFQTPRILPPRRLHTTLIAALASSSSESSTGPLQDLTVAVVGGGPSGLLLVHRLLSAGATVNLYEKRKRPVTTNEKRAYALGVGIRGRTAIQTVDKQLWQAIKKRGFASERFILHIGPFCFRLRDENDGKRAADDAGTLVVEPSLLLFQTDLCRALADELEARRSDSGRMNMKFDCGVTDLNLQSKTLKTVDKSTGTFDLVVGCDGVNSIVRKQIDAVWPDFNTTQDLLPGVFKVVRLSSMPPALDPTAVQLLFPKSGAVSAFVEPTTKGTCCVLFAGRDETDVLLSSTVTNQTAIVQEIEARFPKLVGADLQAAAVQLIEKGKPSQASLVTCNTFHYDGTAVLVGDAAHATGGVSGQGVNSALQDSAALADCLNEFFDASRKDESIRKALLAYSQRAVPEGKALYDLSFGPKPTSALGKIRFAAKSALDTVFKGKLGIGELPLQTKLTTSLESFAMIRKSRDSYYEEAFPDQAYWNATLAELDAKAKDYSVAA